MLGVIALAVCLAICVFDVVGSVRRVGGLTFWKIGRIGGSFYVSRGV